MSEHLSPPVRGPSLWARTASAPTIDDAPPPASADVAIAGAGLTGLSLAVILGQAGARVVVLEARTVGAVTTGNTTGKLSLLQGDVYSQMRAHTDDDTVRAYGDAQRAAQSWLLGAVGAAPGCAETAVSTSYAVTRDGAESLEQELAALAMAGIHPRVAGGGATIGRLPFPVRAALELDGQSQLQPMRVLAELVRQAQLLGVRIVENCRVLGAESAEDALRIETARGEVIADQLVLATGTPILDRGLFFAKLKPSRSFVAAYRVPEHRALPSGMHLSVDEPSYSLRVDPAPDGSPLLLVGGGAHVPGREEHTSRLLAELDSWAGTHWPGAARESAWAAQDYRTSDTVPYAGELPRGGGRIWAATGYNKWGMTNAVAAALRLSGELLGSTPAWSEVLAQRSRGWAAAVNIVRDGAEVAAEMTTGWLHAETTRDASAPRDGDAQVASVGLRPVAESTVDGITCRVSGVCTHMGGVLGWNDAERSWDCPLHGSRFAPDGTLLEGPAVADLERLDTDTDPDPEEKENTP